MATEYGLDVGAPMTADGVGAVLARATAALQLAERTENGFDPPGALLRSGLLVSACPSEPAPFPDPVQRTFGFVPTADVVFRFDSLGDPDDQRRDMVALTAAVLAALPGNARLAHGGEITQLLRLDGKLTISREVLFWTPETEALLPPHDRADLPNL